MTNKQASILSVITILMLAVIFGTCDREIKSPIYKKGDCYKSSNTLVCESWQENCGEIYRKVLQVGKANYRIVFGMIYPHNTKENTYFAQETVSFSLEELHTEKVKCPSVLEGYKYD